MYRELNEETGLQAQQVEVLGRTQDWLYYDIPQGLLGHTPTLSADIGTGDKEHKDVATYTNYRGQKQIWFLLKFIGQDTDVVLDIDDNPEFDQWCWQDYWTPASLVVEFKRDIYRKALTELSALVFDIPVLNKTASV